MADNVLKPLMLGRGVDAPMPIILIGALGGMAAAGILGMFVGATLLALGYQIFMAGWQPGRGGGARAEARQTGVIPTFGRYGADWFFSIVESSRQIYPSPRRAARSAAREESCIQTLRKGRRVLPASEHLIHSAACNSSA
jgi:hypothetical protein